MNDFTRRGFVTATLLLFGGLGVGCASNDPRAGGGGPVDVGPLRDYARDGTIDRFAKSHGVMLVTFGGRLTAVSAVCTADGATLERAKGADGYVCPADGSRFDRAGVAGQGKARDALAHYPMSVNGAGHVIVETGKPLGQQLWGRSDAYLITGR